MEEFVILQASIAQHHNPRALPDIRAVRFARAVEREHQRRPGGNPRADGETGCTASKCSMCDANLIHDLRGGLNLKMPRGSESTAMRKATRALLHAVQQRGGLDGDGHFAEAVGQLEQLSRRQRDADPRSKQHGGAQHKDLLLTMVEKLRQPAPDAEAASDAQPSRPAPLGGPLGEPLGEIVVSLISLVAHMAGTMEDMQSQLKDMQSSSS